MLVVLIAADTTLLLLAKVIAGHERLSIKKTDLIMLLTYMIVALLCVALIDDTDITFIVRFLMLFPLFVIVPSLNSKSENREALNVLGNAIYFLMLCSLILLVIGPYLNLIRPNESVYARWGHDRYYINYRYLLLTEQARAGGLGSVLLYRNLSIYPEGPFSSLIFTIGLAIELFIAEKARKGRVALYLVALLTTISATGMVLSIVIVAIKLLYFTEKSKEGKPNPVKSSRHTARVRAARALLSLILIAGVAYIVWAILYEKQTNDIGNYNSHVNALGNGWKEFLRHPIAGHGFQYDEYYGNSTSGIFKVLVDGGVLLFGLYFIPIAYTVVMSAINKANEMLVMSLLIATLLALVIWQYSPLILYLLATTAVASSNMRQAHDVQA